MLQCLRFGFWVLGFGVWGLGFGVWGLGFRVWGLGFMVWGLVFGVCKDLLRASRRFAAGSVGWVNRERERRGDTGGGRVGQDA